MKKLLLILILFISFQTFGQLVPAMRLNNANFYGGMWVRDSIWGLGTFKFTSSTGYGLITGNPYGNLLVPEGFRFYKTGNGGYYFNGISPLGGQIRAQMGWTNDTASSSFVSDYQEVNMKLRDFRDTSNIIFYSLDMNVCCGLDYQSWDLVGDSAWHQFSISATGFDLNPLKRTIQMDADGYDFNLHSASHLWYVPEGYFYTVGTDTVFQVKNDGELHINDYEFPKVAGTDGQSLQLDTNNKLQWVSVVGVTGPTGPTGATGATGATGPTGPQGASGANVAKYKILNVQHYSVGFPDSTTSPTPLYFGTIPKPAIVTAGLNKIYFNETDTITACDFTANAVTTVGTAEGISLYIVKNGATSHLVQKIYVANAFRRWTNSSLSVPVAAGDYIELQYQFPIFATNPAGVYGGGYITLKYW